MRRVCRAPGRAHFADPLVMTLSTNRIRRELDSEEIVRSSQKLRLGLIPAEQHQALLDAFFATYGEPYGGLAARRIVRAWRAYPTSTPGLRP